MSKRSWLDMFYDPFGLHKPFFGSSKPNKNRREKDRSDRFDRFRSEKKFNDQETFRRNKNFDDWD